MAKNGAAVLSKLQFQQENEYYLRERMKLVESTREVIHGEFCGCDKCKIRKAGKK